MSTGTYRFSFVRFLRSIGGYKSPSSIPETQSSFSLALTLVRDHYKTKFTANSCIALCNSTNAFSFSSARTTKRFPSRCTFTKSGPAKIIAALI